jgi:signal transduction histidine kinase
VTRSASPAHRLLLAVGIILASSVGLTVLSLRQPWFGGVRAPVAVVADGDTVRVIDEDLIEEPDFLDSWTAMDGFFARQDRLAFLLRAPDAALVTGMTAAERAVHPRLATQRPIDSLPGIYWFQLTVGMVAALIGAWVWALRPLDAAARAFGITGVGVLLSAHAAAVYSSRELALPDPVFRALSAANHLGATLFGVALCTLFLVHPRRRASASLIAGLFALCVAWWLADITRVAPDPNWGTRLPLILELAGALALATWQWRMAAGRPQDRAVLRWFAASLLIGPGLFIATLVVTAAVGDAPIPQAYALGFFLPTYLGLAMGLRRIRLFDLDAWALRLLFWGAVLGLFMALDLLVLRLAGGTSARALVVALLLGLLTLPVRPWVWTHLLRRPTVDAEALVTQSLAVAYATSEAERATRWQAQLEAMFSPLVCEPDAESVPPVAAVLHEDGSAMRVPAAAGAGPLMLRYAGFGRRLFSPADQRLVDRLVALLRQADDSRRAYEEGVRGERARIARDLHDSVSSPLLAGLARARELGERSLEARDGLAMQAEIQRAIGAMRTVVRGETAPASLADTLADVRFEAVSRCEQAGVAVDWPLSEPVSGHLSGEQRDALIGIVREAVSNVLRHAQASALAVHVGVTPSSDTSVALVVTLMDNGRGFAPDPTRPGTGLANLASRAVLLGGHCTVGPGPEGRGTVVQVEGRLRLPAMPT